MLISVIEKVLADLLYPEYNTILTVDAISEQLTYELRYTQCVVPSKN